MSREAFVMMFRNLYSTAQGYGWVAALWLIALAAQAADFEEAEALYVAGNYTQCLNVAREQVTVRPYSEGWQILLTKALLATGRYLEALNVVSNSLNRGYASVSLRWVAREVFLSNGRQAEAAEMLDRILRAAAEGRIGDGNSLAVLGRAALVKGVDPKMVLDRMLEPAKKAKPDAREVYLAIGDLALDKHDFALAAKVFQEGLKKLPEDPDLLHGLARAYEPNQQALMLESLEAALKRNSNHTASLLLLADHAIDAEAYSEAGECLDQIRKINPWLPEAWSYRAVIATLENQPTVAIAARSNACKFWPTNPRVPHLIGLKLSQKYRFAEGAKLQREALRFEAGYQPAKIQLAQDLLRLGEETEGWQLADEVQQSDSYNVTANNLMSLHDAMRKFEVLTNEHFQLRMTPHEAALYGQRALELLTEARKKLLAQYGCTLPQTTLVEVFTNQADFAVRTFAMPQNDGYLGVCFGNVITANSPGAYPGHPFNWEAMLWHEFCHVVTLNLTHNKMPRWLSEGISVYEERQANPAWGEHLTPGYREMVLGGGLSAITNLSAAFLMPPSAEHLQFAYYQSSLVVQFIVERFGFPKLQAILRDLGEGVEINQAMARHTVALVALEKDFSTFARELAQRFGPGLDWEKPALMAAKKTSGRGDGEKQSPLPKPPLERVALRDFSWESWLKSHPTNFYALSGRARELMEQQQWSEARPLLQSLLERCPENLGPQSAYALLAETLRALGDTNAERQVLAAFAERDAAASDAFARLMELGSATGDWKTVLLNARRYRAVNPLVPLAYRALANAAEQTGDAPTAIEACRALLELDPPDPAELNYRLARLLHSVGDPAARRHVLQALEEAPRYRAALRLLLELHKNETASTQKSSDAITKP